MNPLLVASRGKGVWSAAKRAGTIVRRYGLTSRNMERSLTGFSQVLVANEGKATFPLTASALERSRDVVERFGSGHIEFAVHGYHHVDHKALSAEEQAAQLTRAAELFTTRGVEPTGFRSPYLRWNDDTIAAIEKAGFEYDSSQAIAWDVVDGSETTERYDRVLEFYGAQRAADTPCVPRRIGDLVRIPYCLPDDEALADRLEFEDLARRNRVWTEILHETHRRGELFTLGLHPERFEQLEQALVETLRAAKQLVPSVWIARLDEIARWWRARTEATITIDEPSPGVFDIGVDGPAGVTLLTKNVESIAPEPSSGNHRSSGAGLRVRSPVRPFVGVSRRTPGAVAPFLREQGFIVEEVDDDRAHGCHIDRPRFDASDELGLLAELEGQQTPLVRLGRWPDGARSALSITGDIDAMTLWDYVGRFTRG